MAWWGALTQQFGELAAQAIKDLPAAATPAAPSPKPAAKKVAKKAVKKTTRTAARKAAPAARTRR